MRRRSGVAALLGVASLAACGGPEAAGAETGRVERVLPTNSAAADFVLALVGPERVVAVPEQAEFFGGAAANAESLTRFASFEAEAVLALEPDLVVTHAWQESDTTRLLRGAGIELFVVREVREFEDLATALRELGARLHAAERAADLVGDLQRRRDALAESAAAEPLRVVNYTDFGTGGWAAGAGTSIDLVIRLAGLRNAAAEAGIDGHAQVDLEQMIGIDPDVLLVSEPEPGSVLGASERYLRAQPALAELAALRANRIVSLPARLYGTNSHHVLEAAEELARRVAALGSTEDAR